ncbi:MAG: S41 family peptidase, partial [Bacteroidota bacterium]
VTFKTLEGKEITRQLKAVKASVAQRRYKKHSESARILQMYKQQRKKWEVRFPDDLPSTAILVIPGFAGKRINYEEQAQDFVENFMDKALETMKKKGTQNLILELRSNSGGWDIMGTTLISYLLKKQDSISYYGDGYAATNQSEFLKHSDVPEYELKNLSEALEPMPDGSFRLKEQYNATYGMIHKRPNAFKGTIYLLMDEYTGSAAAEFSAIMKSNRLATLVGQETNGTYGGLNGSTFIDLSLPNSNIHVRTPLVRGYLAVDPIQPTARGVLPDYEVAFTLEDILNKRDAQMEKVKSLIRQKGNSTQ